MIERAEIKGLTVLANRGIASITLNAQDAIQLIIGHNGSGKSSLLRELNCMPAKPTHYQVGGGKHIVQHYNGHRYEFISVIRKQGGFHSLYKDGEALCENVNATHQASVIEHELGISHPVLKVLYREYKFTKLDPGTLEKLLPQLLKVDLNTGFALYNESRKRKRDGVGVIKHLKQKIESISADMQSMSGIIDAEQQMAEKLALLDKLHVGIRPRAHRVSSCEGWDKTQATLTEMQGTVDKVRTLSPPPPYAYQTIDRPEHYGAATNAVAVLVDRMQSNRDEHRRVREALVENQRLMSVLEETDGGEARLEAECQSLQQALDGITWDGFDLYRDALLDAIAGAEKTLSQADVWLEQGGEEYTIHTPEEAQQIEREMHENRLQYNRYMQRLQALRDTYRAQEAALLQQITCPNCKTVICENDAHALTQADLDKTQSAIARGETLIGELDTAHTVLVDRSRLMAEYRRRLSHLRSLVEATPSLRPFWTQHAGIREISDNLQPVCNALRQLLGNLKEWRKGLDLTARLEARMDTLALYRAASGGNVGERQRQLEQNLSQLDTEYQRLETDLKCLRREIAYFEQLTETHTHLDAMRQSAGETFSDWIRNALHEYAERTHDQHQTELGEIKQRVDRHTALKSQQAAYNTDLSYSLQAKDDLDYLERFLSPRQGFIGQHLKGCIQQLCDRINMVLGHIWTEPLELLPCFTESGLVDYRFKARVNGSIVEKLTELSMGEQDVLDLAFILAIYEINEFECYPLYIDEVGSSFDYGHRQRLMQYIGQLVEIRGYRQVFMINHYAGEYGGLSGMQVLALSENNVVLPEAYNQHVELTYG